MKQLVVKPSVSKGGVRNEEDGVDLMAFDSRETLGINSRIKCLFPCEGSGSVVQKGARDSQRILFVLFTLARLERDLDCWDSRSNGDADIRSHARGGTCLWLRRDIDFFPFEFVVVTIELRGIIMKVVHGMALGDASRGFTN